VMLGHRDHRAPDARIDWVGAILCTVGLGGVVFALIEQSDYGWGAPRIWIPFVVGVISFAAFLVHQRQSSHPMMPLSLFSVRNFSAGNVATAFIYGALSLNGFLIGVYLQQGAGLTATLAGLSQLPATVLVTLLSSRAGALAGRFGPRLFMTVGPLIMAVGALGYLLIGERFDYWWQVLPATLVFGVGLGLTVSPLTSAILGSIEPEHSGIASAVNNAVSRVAGLIVIAMIAVVIGGRLDLGGLHRGIIVCSVLLALGGLVSFAGIRNARPAAESAPVGAGEPAQP